MTKQQFKRAFSEYREMIRTAKFHGDEFLLETAEFYNPLNTWKHEYIIHRWYADWYHDQVF